MAALFTKAFEQVGQLHKTDDDIIDRLNHRFTVVLLVTFSAFVSAKQFIGEPISCWTPAQFSGPQIAYTNSICWLKGTYFLDTDRKTIPHHTENSEFRIAYYQYVPYILLIMALFFYLPHMVWRNFSRRLGFDLRSMIQNVKRIPNANTHQVALQIHIALEYNGAKNSVLHSKILNRLLGESRDLHARRIRLSLLYILIKVLYLINCFYQFYFLSSVLAFPFHKFGIDWLATTLTKVHSTINTDSNESKWFPRAVMCDFMIRHLGSNQHWMAIQCNLPINLFNELIFLIIWAWFILLTSLTCISLVLCIVFMFTSINSTSISKYLHINFKGRQNKPDDFIKNYLKWDGILALRIIAHNTNDIMMSNLVGALYAIYLNSIEQENHDEDDRDDPMESDKLYMHINTSSL